MAKRPVRMAKRQKAVLLSMEVSGVRRTDQMSPGKTSTYFRVYYSAQPHLHLSLLNQLPNFLYAVDELDAWRTATAYLNKVKEEMLK
jgi:hypothetical protein